MSARACADCGATCDLPEWLERDCCRACLDKRCAKLRERQLVESIATLEAVSDLLGEASLKLEGLHPLSAGSPDDLYEIEATLEGLREAVICLRFQEDDALDALRNPKPAESEPFGATVWGPV